ncbi:hypothetical protein Lfu02_72750 [Longispora fulva]|uniref:Uncharacterized protein n=1 Tax=Longispora fulva TaxID=619741 RepID=A0A8J7G558_9ACTN|nr:hypothetical protein [Longispora fulva]MBG6133863.1 hypothetical protein [Longispora fulva]GIG62903.1 hypothetical protein Lfu02_72750 [Longispora fulva]
MRATARSPVPGRRRTPLRAALDHAHGGRWTSLRTTDREWLWHRSTTDRHLVWPGHPFVDAGGLEECVPTVRGVPDHGHAWSRPWRQTGANLWTTHCPDFVLSRSVRARSGAVVADYTLSAEPGYRFVWAAHALLDVGEDATLTAPAGAPTRVYPDAGPTPSGPWPAPDGTRLDVLGPDDATAVGAILLGCASVLVTDGPDALDMSLHCPGQPVSTALWRNLRGWPPEQPYRSIGVEPMLGGVFDLAEAGPDEAATVPASGVVSWRLTLTAHTNRKEQR